MDFKVPYAEAMRQQAPKMFNSLNKTGQLEAHLTAKSQEAHKLFAELTAKAPKDPTGYPKEPFAREAEEQVKAVLIEFPPESSSPTPTAIDDQQNALLPRPAL